MNREDDSEHGTGVRAHASLTQTLAEHIASTSYASLPPEEIVAARMSLVETIGCALAAKDAPGTREVLAACQEEGGNPRSTIWVTGQRTSARQAAFANSVFGAALDYDSVFHEGTLHSDIIVVPAALAVAEAVGSSGEDLLRAVVLGNDVLCRLSLATKAPKKGWFFSSVYGVLVAAAVTAKLLGGDAKKIAHAIGLASLNAAGTYQPLAERSLSKRALAAFAAQAGIHCGQLAAAGFEGVDGGIEGAHGLFALYNDGDPARVIGGLGETFLGSSIGRKPFPSCQCNHAPIEAALAIRREHGVSVDDIEEIQVLLSAHGCRIVGAPYRAEEASQTAAQFSVQYSVACAFVQGDLGIKDIQLPVLADPQIRLLVSRVRVIEDPTHSNSYVPATLAVRLRNGDVISKTVTANRGSAELALSRAEMLDKFNDCVTSSFPRLGKQEVTDMFSALENFDQVPNVERAMRQLTQRWVGQ